MLNKFPQREQDNQDLDKPKIKNIPSLMRSPQLHYETEENSAFTLLTENETKSYSTTEQEKKKTQIKASTITIKNSSILPMGQWLEGIKIQKWVLQ